jgi:di/tricarboxylate transporter
MNADIILQFVMVAVAVALFASDRVRPDMVAVGIILVLMLSGQLSPAESLAGFSNSLVLMIAGLFIVGEGLAQTGIAHALGDMLTKRAGGSETRLVVNLMLVVALLSAFMSSTGAVAVFIPVTMTLARRTGTPPARLLMPMAFASLLGGMLTLIGTPPNLAVSTELERTGGQPFAFFDFTPLGLVVLAGCAIWVVLVSRRQLRGEATAAEDGPLTLMDIGGRYDKIGKARSLRVTAESTAIGCTVESLHLGGTYGMVVLGIARNGRFGREALAPRPDLALLAGDLVDVLGEDEPIDRLIREHGFEAAGDVSDHRDLLQREVGLAEALVPPGSPLAGRSVQGGRIRTRTGLTVIALMHRDGSTEDAGPETMIDAGDTLLVTSDWRAIRGIGHDPRLLLPLNLPRELADVAPARSRAPLSLGILLAMLAVMTFNLMPAVAAVLLAALAMVACRCVAPGQIYSCVGWPSIVLIAGMLPLATAMERSGAITLIVDGVVGSLGPFGPRALLGGLFLLTAAFSQFISNTATAVLVAPIAALAAREIGVSPQPMLMAVALAASAAFLTPVASPVNTLVMGPGGYKFMDFFKIGTPLLLITLAVSLFLVPLIFPF